MKAPVKTEVFDTLISNTSVFGGLLVSIGNSGTQDQGLNILAMHKVFLNNYVISPISWMDNMVLALGKVVEVVDGEWK